MNIKTLSSGAGARRVVLTILAIGVALSPTDGAPYSLTQQEGRTVTAWSEIFTASPGGYGEQNAKTVVCRMAIPLTAKNVQVEFHHKTTGDEWRWGIETGPRALNDDGDWKRFVDYNIEDGVNQKLLAVTFKNWAENKERQARMKVTYFLPAP